MQTTINHILKSCLVIQNNHHVYYRRVRNIDSLPAVYITEYTQVFLRVFVSLAFIALMSLDSWVVYSLFTSLAHAQVRHSRVTLRVTRVTRTRL